MPDMTSLAVSAIGVDRPGIVAAVTAVLYDHGANVEDTSMTILRGHFAMTLVVAGAVSAAALDAALAPVAATFELLVSVREIGDDAANAPVSAPYVVSVYGADRTGIVARVSGVLATLGVNITDLSTRLHGETYVMVIEVDVPAAVSPESLAAALASVASDLGVTATLHPAAADVL